jgi:histidinol-phosphate phosphatase family domain/HAD-superfamily hydrolase, subfamily IIIA
LSVQPRKFVLLDRDGTIIVNKHYQKDPDDTELLPNAKEGLDLLRAHDFGLVMLTNQSGIGRGYLTRADLAAINRRLIIELGGGDGYFSGVYYCPHLPDEGCGCRKPRPGLAELAAYDLGFSLGDCYMVGDRESDIEMGDSIGASTVLVRTGYGHEIEKAGTLAPDYVAEDLLDTAEWIIRREEWVKNVTRTRRKDA